MDVKTLASDVNPEGLQRFKSDEFLPPIQAWTHLGGYLLVGTVGVAIAIAAVLEYKVVIKAPATVRPQGGLQTVQASTAGVVTQILVTEHQTVKQGEVMASLDTSQQASQSKPAQRQQKQTQLPPRVQNPHQVLIRAPKDGKLLNLELHTIGQVVQPGTNVAQIVPYPAALVVKARVAPQDIGQVAVCQTPKIAECQVGKALLRVSAYPYPDFGVLPAVVRTISPDVLTAQDTDEGNQNETASFYEVTLQPQTLSFVKDGRQYPIRVGMDATAEIISREEPLLTFILRKARLLTQR